MKWIEGTIEKIPGLGASTRCCGKADRCRPARRAQCVARLPSALTPQSLTPSPNSSSRPSSPTSSRSCECSSAIGCDLPALPINAGYRLCSIASLCAQASRDRHAAVGLGGGHQHASQSKPCLSKRASDACCRTSTRSSTRPTPRTRRTRWCARAHRTALTQAAQQGPLRASSPLRPRSLPRTSSSTRARASSRASSSATLSSSSCAPGTTRRSTRMRSCVRPRADCS